MKNLDLGDFNIELVVNEKDPDLKEKLLDLIENDLLPESGDILVNKKEEESEKFKVCSVEFILGDRLGVNIELERL